MPYGTNTVAGNHQYQITAEQDSYQFFMQLTDGYQDEPNEVTGDAMFQDILDALDTAGFTIVGATKFYEGIQPVTAD